MIQIAHAQTIAQELIDLLKPFCNRIEVAGSVRRKKPIVKDIELVIIPKQEITFEGLFKDETVITYPIDKFLWEDYRFDFRLNKDGKRMYGDKNKLLLYTSNYYGQIALDIFTANEFNYTMIKFIRTGGAETNKRIAVTANKMKMNLKIYESCFEDRHGNKAIMKSEKQIFEYLGLKYLNPEERT